MLRGMVYVELTLKGPSHDLHSGMYGGAVVNPINALCRLVAELHDEQGRVQIPGFYDGVREIGEAELAAWQGLGLDERDFLATAGLRTPGGGERDRSVLERTWSRPTCDVERDLGRLHRGGLEDRDRVPRLGEALLPPRARPGPAQGAGGHPPLRRGAAAAGLHLRAAGVRRLARDPGADRLALPGCGQAGGRRRVRRASRC